MAYKLDIDPIAIYNKARPESPMRELLFGADAQGKVTYLILEHQQRVDVL